MASSKTPSSKTPSSSSLASGSSQSSVDPALSRAASAAGDGIDYKDRCQTLEATLYKFKQQASKIRDLLAEKVAVFADLVVVYSIYGSVSI